MNKSLQDLEAFCDANCTWSDHHKNCQFLKSKDEFSNKKTKRPYAQPNAQRRSIYTDDETWAKLKAMGKGNVSAGIRESVRKAEDNQT